jgi:hypothetical protein
MQQVLVLISSREMVVSPARIGFEKIDDESRFPLLQI